MRSGTYGRGRRARRVRSAEDVVWTMRASWNSRGDRRRSRDFRPLDGGVQSPHAGSVLVDEGLELVDEPEAMRLLAGGEVGRVGLTIGALPAIFP